MKDEEKIDRDTERAMSKLSNLSKNLVKVQVKLANAASAKDRRELFRLLNEVTDDLEQAMDLIIRA